jgi:hypothetical protein
MEVTCLSLYRKPAASLPWGAASKVVDADGNLIAVFRGQHGANDHWGETLLGSLSFGSAAGASAYATSPNVTTMVVQAPKVFPVHLNIENPFVDCPDDPFMDLSRYNELFGLEETRRIAVKFKNYVEHTNAWLELSEEHGIETVVELAEARPDLLLELYFEVYALLDDPVEVAILRAAGFDGAIHGGSGETALEPEYRVFSEDQVRSVWDTRLAA